MLAPMPIGKMVCVGRNYGAHAAELGNAIPEQPLLFMKPASAWQPLALSNDHNIVRIPTNLGACHHELELTLLIGESLSGQASPAIIGVGLGLDLTLRDLQDQLKGQGQPWERAKAFAGSAPLTEFIALADLGVELNELTFTLHRNGQLQQNGRVTDMIFPIEHLVSEIESTFTLQPGDIIFTGTPAGVSALNIGDQLKLTLQAGAQSFDWFAEVRGE